MIVEPVPTNPPSRRRRALGRLVLLVPVLLLVAVIGAAVLGRTATPDERAAILDAPSVDPAATAQATATPPSPAPRTLVSASRPQRAPFPVSIDGLAVQSVPQALAGPAIDGRGDVVAIAGYFGIPVVPTGCGDGIDPLGPLCDRSTLLAEIQWSLVSSQGFSGIGAHVHAHAAVGVRLPAEVQRTTMAASGPPLTAVLIGRFGGFEQPNCSAPNAGCEVSFELDAVAWAEGSPFEVRPFVDPMIESGPPDWLTINRDRVATKVVGSNGIVLEAALLRPETVARLDPRAARRIRKADPKAFVWYVRGLRPTAGGAPDLVWGVVDDTSLRMLATGVAAAAGGTLHRDGVRGSRTGSGRDHLT